MTYRDGTASLEERHRMLRSALQETRARSSALTEEEALIHRELAALHQALESAHHQKKRQLPIARTLIASPCDVPWDDMVGDARVRHCGKCQKDVHNLSAMTTSEVEAFLERARLTSTNGSAPTPTPCVSLWQRVDGTILTADCPVGVRRRRIQSLLAVGFGLGTAAIVSFTALAIVMGDSGARRLEDPVEVSFRDDGPSSVAHADNGYIEVGGVSGLLVYENNQFKGVVPVSFAATPGTHTLRIEDPKSSSETQLLSTFVRERSVAHVTALGFVRQPPQQKFSQMAGGLMPPPPPPVVRRTKVGGKVDGDSDSQTKTALDVLKRAELETGGTL